MERGPTPDGDDGSPKRAISPVVGVALMIVITVLLSASIAGALFAFSGELEEPNLEAPAENPWADDPLFGPEDPTAGATDVRYRVYFEIEDDDADELADIRISVTTGDDMFGEPEQLELETLLIEAPDGSETSIRGDFEAFEIDEGGSELDIELDGNEDEPQEGDAIVAVLDGIDNPTVSGTYDVEVEINGDEQKQGELEIIEGFNRIAAGNQPEPAGSHLIEGTADVTSRQPPELP